MREFIPDAVAPDREGQEDGRGDNCPPKFQGIVAMAVVGFVARATAVFDEIDDIDTLRGYENDEREPEDEIQDAVNFLTANGDVFWSPVEIVGAGLGLGNRRGKTKEQETEGGDSEK